MVNVGPTLSCFIISQFGSVIRSLEIRSFVGGRAGLFGYRIWIPVRMFVLVNSFITLINR